MLEPLPTYTDPEISGPPPPPQPSLAPAAFLAIAIFVFALVIIVRARLRRRGHDIPGGFRSLPGGTGVANALMDLNSMLQPDRPVAEVIMQLEDEDEQDARGDHRDPEHPSGPATLSGDGTRNSTALTSGPPDPNTHATRDPP